MQCNRTGNIRHVVWIVEWIFSAASSSNTKEDCSFFLQMEIDRVQLLPIEERIIKKGIQKRPQENKKSKKKKEFNTKQVDEQIGKIGP